MKCGGGACSIYHQRASIHGVTPPTSSRRKFKTKIESKSELEVLVMVVEKRKESKAERERERERKERKAERERKKILKTLTSCYSRVSKMRFYCNSMLKILRFSIFDVGVFLSFDVLKMLKNSI